MTFKRLHDSKRAEKVLLVNVSQTGLINHSATITNFSGFLVFNRFLMHCITAKLKPAVITSTDDAKKFGGQC